MIRKGNNVRVKNQEENLVTVGADLGGTLWATNYLDWSNGKSSYKKYKDNDSGPKEEQLYKRVSEFLANGRHVHVFYEAGRYGFVPARILESLGAKVTILPVNKLSILNNGKQVKTDRVDARFLSELHPSDDLPHVRIPSVKTESRRGALRELERLKTEIKKRNSQLIAFLNERGIYEIKTYRSSGDWLKLVKRWNNSKKLPSYLTLLDVKRMDNIVKELILLERNRSLWEEELRLEEERERQEAAKVGKKTLADQLAQFYGIGEIISRTFAWELDNFERFKNGRKLGSFVGLTPTPWSSGTMRREQGISKAGNKRIRTLAIEMAWLWARYQPNCDIVKRHADKLAQRGRQRKTAIVALARQILVGLFRFIRFGEEIKGVRIKAQA